MYFRVHIGWQQCTFDSWSLVYGRTANEPNVEYIWQNGKKKEEEQRQHNAHTKKIKTERIQFYSTSLCSALLFPFLFTWNDDSVVAVSLSVCRHTFNMKRIAYYGWIEVKNISKLALCLPYRLSSDCCCFETFFSVFRTVQKQQHRFNRKFKMVDFSDIRASVS